MNDLDKLHEISDQVLYGLTADESLKRKIIEKASGKTKSRMQGSFRPLPVFCTALAVLLISIVALNRLPPVNPADSVEMNVFAAGIKETIQPEEVKPEKESIDLDGILPDDVVSVELSGSGRVTDQKQCAELIRMLTEEASLSMTNYSDFPDKLTIVSGDGTIVEFAAASPYLMGKNCWSCQSFFALFHQYINQ